MPSLIPSYISRLRTHSQSTAASSSSQTGSHSNSTAGPSTPGSELARLAADPLVGQSGNKIEQMPPLQVAGKIHPDLNELLGDSATPEGQADDLGPRPPKGRSRSAEQLTKMKSNDIPERIAKLQEEQSAVAATPPSSRSPLLSRILSVPLLSSVMSTPHSDMNAEPDSGAGAHWSTFGRRRSAAPTMGEFGSLHRRGSGSKSSAHSKSPRRTPQSKSASVTPTTTRSPSARTGTLSRTQTVETAPSQSNSPAGTVSSSSKSHSGRSHSLHSRRPPLAYPETIPDAEPDPQTPAPASVHAPSSTSTSMLGSPLTARPMLDDSPHTFGRGTPERSDKVSRPYPELSNAFIPPSTTNPSPRRHNPATRDPPATFPQRRRTRQRPATGSLVSFPSTVSTRADVVFQASDHGVGKRLSAAWSATEAIRNGENHEGETWPATVSREMVRLALTGGMLAGRDAETAVEELGALSEARSKNATFFGSTGEDRRRFMWAARKRTNTTPSTPAKSSSSAPQQSMHRSALTVSQPSGSGSAAAPGAGEGPHEGRSAPHVSVTAPTPTQSTSPSGSRFGTISDSTPGLDLGRNSQSQGKRKIADANDEESLRPEGTVSSGSGGPASKHVSDASRAPSSFRQPKRIRLSTPSHSPEHLSRSQSRSSHISPPGSPRSRPPSSLRTLPNQQTASQTSIPLRAIISPRPPSLDRRSTYHMRDPALPPPRRQSAQWAGSARKIQEEGRRVFPLQGWAFILGFVLFPMWWAAAIAPVGWGWGLHVRGKQDGKAVLTGEAELEARTMWEYDVAATWRRRCRLMSILGLLVYIPLIVLLAVLVPRA